MKRFIIFIFIPILMVGQEAWAKDQPGDLGKTDAPPRSLSLQRLLETQEGQRLMKHQEMTRLVSDVVNGKAIVKPSMVPPEIFDRIYFVEKQTQDLMADMEKNVSAASIVDAKWMFYLGQLTAMRDLLYIVGILPKSFYSPDTGGRVGFYQLTAEAMYSSGADRTRLITAMLLLLNYKESNPIPLGDIVQVTTIR